YYPIIFSILFGCIAENTNRPNVIVDPNGGFWDQPWPSDNHLNQGRPDFSQFPTRGENPLLDGFLDLAETLDGFGTSSACYVRLDGTLDLSQLPTPQESLERDSAILLINIDPDSAEFSTITPIHWSFQETATTWQPDHFLAVAPIWGFSLLPATRYALVLKDSIINDHSLFPEVFDPMHEKYIQYKELKSALVQQGVYTDTIAFANQFTTQNPLKDLARIHQRIHTELSKPRLDQELRFKMSGQNAEFYDGQMLIPNWQQGEKPYSGDGGYFAYTADGRPMISEWEKTAFRLSLPDGPMPESGWPVIIYSHGTGGDHTTFANSVQPLEPANVFADIGAVGIGISQPLHGDRNPGEESALSELWSFNYLNPPAGRTMFRQGAADQMYLSALLASHDHEFTTDDGRTFSIDPTNIHYVGHSHGGEVGALALPFMGSQVQSAVLSGAGGGLSLTLMYRDSGDFDIDTLLRTALEFSEDEVINEFHPIISLVQFTAEATDPINYAPYWYDRKGWWDGQAPIHVLTTEGLSDVYTPPISTEALSAAAKQPILSPTYQSLPAHQIRNLAGADTPVKQNNSAFNGQEVTAGLAQYPDDGHFAIFNNPDAAVRYQSFLSEAIATGSPSIK
ncbi:MAG: hypothetical protein VXZ96_15405, partial [Myxococcota bacterium]|nr:hypothetical protein [Myxococcota bacterium]